MQEPPIYLTKNEPPIYLTNNTYPPILHVLNRTLEVINSNHKQHATNYMHEELIHISLILHVLDISL